MTIYVETNWDKATHTVEIFRGQQPFAEGESFMEFFAGDIQAADAVHTWMEGVGVVDTDPDVYPLIVAIGEGRDNVPIAVLPIAPAVEPAPELVAAQTAARRTGRPPLADNDPTVAVTFKLPSALLGRIDDQPDGRSAWIRSQVERGLQVLDAQADTVAKWQQWDRPEGYRPPNPTRIAQVREEVDADEMLLAQLGYVPRAGDLRHRKVEVFGPLKRMMAGLGGLHARGNVQYTLEWDKQIEMSDWNVQGEYEYTRRGVLTVWSSGGAWSSRPVWGEALVTLTLHWGQYGFAGEGGSLWVASGDRTDATRFHGRAVSDLLADLLPHLLVRQQVSKIMGGDPFLESGRIEPPTWDDLSRPRAEAKQVVDLVAARAAYAALCAEAYVEIDEAAAGDRHEMADRARADRIAEILTAAGWEPETREGQDGTALWAVRRDRLSAVNDELKRLQGWSWIGVHIPVLNVWGSRTWSQIPTEDVAIEQFVCWVKP